MAHERIDQYSLVPLLWPGLKVTGLNVTGLNGLIVTGFNLTCLAARLTGLGPCNLTREEASTFYLTLTLPLGY